MIDPLYVAELQQQIERLEIVIRSLIARGAAFRRPEPGEYYKAGFQQACRETAAAAEAGLAWARGEDRDPLD